MKKGPTSRLILIGLTQNSTENLAKGSTFLASKLQDSGYFSSVQNGEKSRSHIDFEFLFTNRYLLSSSVKPERFRVPYLRQAFEERLQDLTGSLPPFLKEKIPNDPTAEFLQVLNTWTPPNSPRRLHGVWFSSDNQTALLAAETQASGFDLDTQRNIQLYIQDSISQMNTHLSLDIPIQVILSGTPVFAVASRAAIKQEAQWMSVIATILVIGFLYLRFRSVWLIALSILPLATGLLAGVIVVNSLYGYIHGITLAFGITLIGVAIDYPIHIFSHLQSQRAPSEVVRNIWPTMRLGGLHDDSGI